MDGGRIAVGGTELSAAVEGRGPPVLFIPGFTLDHRMWDDQRALADAHRLVRLDPRGFGRSALPDGTRYRHADDAAALLSALGLGPACVVGHSIGAHQALELALEHPDRVSSLVLVCTSGLGGMRFPEEIHDLFAAVKRAAREEGIDAAKAIWRRGSWFGAARRRADLGRRLDEILADYSAFHWTHENPVAFADPPPCDRLEEIGVPTLVVTGEEDLPYNAEVGRVLIARIAGAREVRLPSGHLPSMEAPGPFNAALRGFLQGA